MPDQLTCMDCGQPLMVLYQNQPASNRFGHTTLEDAQACRRDTQARPWPMTRQEWDFQQAKASGGPVTCSMNPLHDGPCDGGPYAAGGSGGGQRPSSTTALVRDKDGHPLAEVDMSDGGTLSVQWPCMVDTVTVGPGGGSGAPGGDHVYVPPQDWDTSVQDAQMRAAQGGDIAALSTPQTPQPWKVNRHTTVAKYGNTYRQTDEVLAQGQDLTDQLAPGQRQRSTLDQALLDLNQGDLIAVAYKGKLTTHRVKHVDKLAGTITLDQHPDTMTQALTTLTGMTWAPNTVLDPDAIRDPQPDQD